ncbi:MAG: 50S ribosomal protein L13 [Candidatus Doudnabacteria bacterium]
MKTQKVSIPKVSEVTRQWFVIDASKDSMGRIATKIAQVLRGKHKRDYTPHMDMGDFVVAINTDKLKFTGRKVEQKKYYHHSGYLGGLKTYDLKDELEKHPEQVLRRAVFSMIDEVRFRNKLMSRLKLVKGSEHSYKIDKELN